MICKYCSEEIKNEAIICIHCGRDQKGNFKLTLIISFLLGFIVSFIGIMSLYSWNFELYFSGVVGFILIFGCILGGIFTLIAKMFKL